MNVKRSIIKRLNRILGIKEREKSNEPIINLYNTNYHKRVLLSYLTTPFKVGNEFTHQNYLTSHIIAQCFSELSYNVDVYDFRDTRPIDYAKYSIIFGFGEGLERSFYHPDRTIPRVYFVTGAHHDLHNSMSLKSIKDFYKLSGLWLANEANVLKDCSYYSIFNSDFAIILAHGYVFEQYKDRFDQKLYSLNNNILNAFSDFKPKTIETRNRNFLYLSGAKQVTKGLHFVLELAKIREDLNFYIMVPSLDVVFESHYKDVLEESHNVWLFKNLNMKSNEMREIVEKCSYSLAPSYVDGLPGGTIEPMSAGLVPIVSQYCGFPKQDFIFEMKELSLNGLNEAVDRVLGLDDNSYIKYSSTVKAYALEQYNASYIKSELIRILRLNLNSQD